MSLMPFNNSVLQSWLSLQQPFAREESFRLVVETDGQAKTYIGVYGSGPFAGDEFRYFGESLGFYVVAMDEVPDFRGLTLVLGEVGWDEVVLGDYLDRALAWAAEIDYPVRIYSQQMFLVRVTAGIDPFDAPLELLREFGRGHPALDYLADLGFDWPSCQAIPSVDGEFELGPIGPEESPLRLMGYRVGKSGIQSSPRRRKILRQAFLGELPPVEPSSYLRQWGEPNTSRRLKKMANYLAYQAHNAKRREDDMALAILHWESDLEWLKQTFYTGKFRFQWPSTD